MVQSRPSRQQASVGSALGATSRKGLVWQQKSRRAGAQVDPCTPRYLLPLMRAMYLLLGFRFCCLGPGGSVVLRLSPQMSCRLRVRAATQPPGLWGFADCKTTKL